MFSTSNSGDGAYAAISSRAVVVCGTDLWEKEIFHIYMEYLFLYICGIILTRGRKWKI